jgi:hypothetical protein
VTEGPYLAQDDWGYHEAARDIAYDGGHGGPLAELVAMYRADPRLEDWAPRFTMGENG